MSIFWSDDVHLDRCLDDWLDDWLDDRLIVLSR